MKTWTDKELRALLKMLMDTEKGKHISDLDRAYKRGWRDCIRSVRGHLDKRRDAAVEKGSE